jgi:hypothetical protein
MSATSLAELAKLPHINTAGLQGRTVLLMPVWDGATWSLWVDGPEGQLIKVQVVDAARSNYLAQSPARQDDLHIPFVDLMWQRASWPTVSRLIMGICDDFHLMATIAAKLEHFHETRDGIPQNLIGSFVQTEIEHLIIVARSIFDLLQEILADLWNNGIRLLDATAEAKRKSRKLHDTFRKVVLSNNETLRSATEIADIYGLPPPTSEMYQKHAPFFLSLRASRDRIIHGGSSVDFIFSTDKGFCVDPKSKYFRDFSWQKEHYFNDNIVSLRPWLANIVLQTIEACSDIMFSLASVVAFPEAVSPDYQVFIRDPSNEALLRLLDVANGNLIWWDRSLNSSRGPNKILPAKLLNSNK